MSKKKDRNGKYWGKKRNHHHLKNKCRGGLNTPNNLLLIKVERHKMWHKLFGNLSLNEVIDLLVRLREAKGYFE